MILEIDFWADYGHFSHPATIYSSLTYPIPPKTTIIGFLAAVGGLENIDEYAFLNAIKYSVVIKKLKGKINFVFNGVKDALPVVKNYQQTIKQRKQFYRELLVEPYYTLYIDFSACYDESLAIIENLKAHRSIYQPYMGVNFCLANFAFVDEHKGIEETNNAMTSIDSFIPLNTSFELETNKSYSDVRIATTIGKGRLFGGFSDLLVELSGQSILANPSTFTAVGEQRLLFI
jgi:CRISPR-associated protein Cas5h